MFVKYKSSVWLLLILAIILGGLFLSNTYILPYPHIRNFSFYKSEPVIIKGVVVNFPNIKPNSIDFVLSTQELTWAGKVYPVCGKVLVKVFRDENISYADQLFLKGRLFRPYKAKKMRFSYKNYLEDQGIYSILTVSKDKPIRNLGRARLNPLKLFAFKIREKAGTILFKYLNSIQAGIFQAMILGDRSKIPPSLVRLFIQTGTMHILAISGLHIGIVVFIMELFLKALGLKRKPRYLLIILFLVLYCILTGARASVVRATIMAALFLTAFLLKREIQIPQTLALAALIILVANPHQLFSPGFQLSFVSVISIVYLSPLIRNFYISKSKLCNYRPIGFIISVFSVSLSAWLGVLPFVIHYFKIISPVTVLANMVVVPCLALVIALGINFLFFGITLPYLASIFALPAGISIAILVRIIRLFSQIPHAYFYL